MSKQPTPGARFDNTGEGKIVPKHCMGCGLWKTKAGAKGVGVRYRCGDCVAKRVAAVLDRAG